MHPDARIIIAGGVGICLVLLAIGAVTTPAIAGVGFAINAGGLLGAMLLEWQAPPP